MTPRTAKIVEISRERLPETARMLTKGFIDDPLMRYLFAAQDDYPERLREFFRYNCEIHAEMSWPLVGVEPCTRLAGAVAAASPEERPWPEELNQRYARFTARLTKPALDRIERYADRTNKHFPDQPLFYIGMIGVRPQSQGQGYARLLLEEIHRRSEAHPRSTGVALDTENPANVPLYQGFGYQVVAKVKLDDFDVWCMFRPNGVSSRR
jgi:GNAT superfamily N-acetyltransferase